MEPAERVLSGEISMDTSAERESTSKGKSNQRGSGRKK
jgi:hypothetical protein